MKKIITILLLAVSSLGISQTSDQPRDPLNQKDYSAQLKSPYTEIIISVYKTATVEEKTLVLKAGSRSCKVRKGIVIKLSTGEVLTFEKNLLQCTPLLNDDFVLSGSIVLTPELYSKLSQAEIKEFRLGEQKVPVAYREKNENLKALFTFSESH